MADGPVDNLQELPQQIQRVLDHYRLVDNPFGKAVDAKVFSRAGNRAGVAGRIERLLRSSENDCLLVAPAEGGKRTLARQVARQLGQNWRVAWIDPVASPDTGNLVRELVGQLRLGEEIGGTAADVARRIAQLVARKAEGGERRLLVVQNADRLPAGMQQWLRSLRTYADRPDTRLRQLWLAESAEAVELAEGDKAHWTTVTLDPLTDDEALEYLRDRFAAAGLFDAIPIDAKQAARLNRAASGWPGRLNRAALDSLVAGLHTAIDWRPAARVLSRLAGVAALVLIAVLAFTHLWSGDEPGSAEEEASLETEPAWSQAGLDPVIDEPGDESDQAADQAEPATTSGEEATEVAATAGDQPVETAAATTTPDSTASNDEDEEGEGKEREEAIEAVEAAEREHSGNGEEAEPTPERAGYTVQLAGARSRPDLAALNEEFAVGMETTVARTTRDGELWYVLIAGRHETASQARAAISRLPPEIRERSPWPRPLANLELLDSAASTAGETVDAPAEDAGSGEAREDDAAERDAAFTLQLVGVRDRGSLETLRSDLANPDDFEIVQTTLDGRPWYVLTHGRYETARAARATIDDLPEKLRDYEPWPRPVSDFDTAAP